MGQFGTAGRNIFRGSGFKNWDVSVTKEFSFRETLKAQFRAEIFNIFNHPNFGPPGNTLGTPLFGLSSETYGANLGTGGATLGGTVNASGTSTTPAFDYGLTTAYGNTVAGATVELPRVAGSEVRLREALSIPCLRTRVARS